MSKYQRSSFAGIRTISILNRKSKVSPSDFAVPFDEREDSFSAFVKGMPRILVADDLRAVADAIVASRRKNKPVILMMGAHVIKVGLAPVIIDLVRRKMVTAVAMNSAASIHDTETALWGQTSEDVAVNMLDGTFGMARETGEFINGTLVRSWRTSDEGYGEALGKELAARRAKFRRVSILASCYDMGVPVTVHAAIGTDIIHQQPTMNGGATGEMSFRDFQCLCETCKGLVGGGVVLNIGSAMIMPEVFLKALTVARNLGAKAKGFTTAVFDMNMHYRPTMNVRIRPTQDGGKGYAITGHHEIMVPLLAAMVALKTRSGRKRK
jgi:hypothetical protein